MTITNSDNQRHADPQRPAEIADDEWAAVLRVRQRKAEEAAAAEHCTHVMADLNGAADGGFEDEDGTRSRGDFSTGAPHWGDGVSGEFAFALMRAQGFKNRQIPNYGWACLRKATTTASSLTERVVDLGSSDLSAPTRMTSPQSLVAFTATRDLGPGSALG